MSKNNLLRVTQMNAVYLDKEIYNCLQAILQEATRYLPPCSIAPYQPELNLALRLAVFTASVWRNDSTFGQQLLSVRYQRITLVQKILYLLSQTTDYLQEKLEWWRPTGDLNGIVTRSNTILQMLELANVSMFLRTGTRPLLIERVLGLDQEYATGSGQRQFESKYLTRELLWNGFIEVLVYVLPLINYHKIRRTVKRYNPLRKKVNGSIVSSRTMSMYSKCAVCEQNPILPHHMGCAHIFCYVCLKSSQVADSRFECPACEHKNPNLLCDKVLVM